MRDSVRLGVVALGAMLGLGVCPEARAAEPVEGRLAPFQFGGRVGFGGAPYVRTGDLNGTNFAVQMMMAARLGVRLATALSIHVEGAILTQALVLGQTTIYYEIPPDVPRYPGLLGVVSGTVGLRPIRYLELSLGPTVGGGPTLVGGGTVRLGVRIPTRAHVVLTPGFEGYLLSGDRTGYGAIFGTFGFEI